MFCILVIKLSKSPFVCLGIFFTTVSGSACGPSKKFIGFSALYLQKNIIKSIKCYLYVFVHSGLIPVLNI